MLSTEGEEPMLPPGSEKEGVGPRTPHLQALPYPEHCAFVSNEPAWRGPR
jgi:hypothetical protein